jgi:WD40 repeat protein
MSDPGLLVNCPYKGLEPYTERDAAVFAGRGEDIARVISNLYASSLIILYGESGVGKTSLLWAGVVPQLKKDVPELKKKKRVAVVVFREWQSKDFQRRLRETVLLALLETINTRLLKPGSPPLDLERLKSALNRTLAENSAERNGNGLPAPADELSPPQNVNDLPLDRFLMHCADAIQGRIFFIIDQFEEYFLYHPPSESDNDFDEQPACAVNSLDVPVSFLISLREEGLSKLDRLLGRIPRLLSNMLRIEHLSRTGAHAAIEEPLTKTPEVEIDDNLIPELFKQLDPDLVGFDESNRPKPLSSKGDESRVNGSFLQIVLTRLWGEEIAKGAKRLTLHKFEELGGANKIAGDYFDDVMGNQLRKAVLARNAAATENEICEIRDNAADLFKFLVTVIGSKFAPTVGDLAGLMHRTPDLAFDTPQCRQRRLEKVYQTLEILGDIRVVRLVDGAANIAARRYEIAHDVLGSAIRRWRERHETDKARREAEREKEEAEERARMLEEKRQLEERNRRLAEGIAREQELQAKNACRMANRFRRLFVVATGLCIIAVGLLAWAINSTVRLKHNTVRLKDSTARLKEMFGNVQRQLHIDSMVSFNTGDRLMQLDQWSEGMLRLAQACKCDPQNAVVAERFFYELINHRSQARRVPVSSISSQGLVFHAVMSADDKEVLIAGSAGARVYDAERGNVIGPFVCPGTVYTAVFDRNGNHILTASADGKARLWESASGQQLRSFQHDGPVLSAVFNPDETRILTASADDTARLWESASGEQLLPFQHGGPVLSAVFSPDGTRILTASKDSTAVLWDAKTGGRLQTFCHKGPVLHATFSAEGKVVLTASEDGTARLWNATTGAVIQSFPHAGPVVNILFNPQTAGILTASEDKTAKLWNAETGALIYSFEHADKLSDTAFSPDGNRILTASADKTVRL